MNFEQINQARILFEQVMNLTLSHAKSYLDENCFDIEVRAEVEFLLIKYKTAEHPKPNNETKETTTIADTLNPDASLLEPNLGGGDQYFTSLIGKTFNNTYFIERQIGQGGMGLVFAAKHLLLGTDVAIKVLSPTLKKNITDVKRFQREARVGWSLSHPNIVKIFELSQTQDNILFIVMEFVKGDNLKNYIQRSAPLSPHRCYELLKPLCKALSFAHKNNVLHRDLKPANILISEENQTEIIKLADFGIAKLLKSGDDITQGTILTTEGTVIGSLDYMSPEQFMDYKLGTTSDIYSLGVILHEMLTKKLPIYGSSPQDLLKLKTTYHKMPLPSKQFTFLSSVFDDLLRKALSPIPQDRYQKPEDLLNAFEECLSHQI